VYGLACTLRAGNIPAPPEDERTFLQNYMTGLMNRLDDPILASQKDVALSTGQVGLQTCFDYKIPGGHAFRACACVAIRRPAFLFYMDYTGLRLEVEKISHTIHKALLQSRLNPLERANNTSELTS
jgi:hypothetical protein